MGSPAAGIHLHSGISQGQVQYCPRCHQFSTCATVQPAKQEMTRDLPISDESIWKAQQADPEILKICESMIGTGALPHTLPYWRTMCIVLSSFP